jgi:flagellar biosynthesis protein FlhA
VKRVHEGQAKAQPTKTPESMADLLTIDPIEVELGYGLIPLADAKQGGDLLERITAARKHAALDLGLLVPPIRIRDNMQLKPNTYCVKLRGVEIASGEVYPGQLLAMNSNGVAAPLQGIETVEPTFGLPATWISDVQQSEAELVGYTVVDPLSVMITHLTEILRRNAAEVLTRQDTQTLIDSVKANSPAVVDELIPNLLTVGDVQKVLQNLLAERVSIRDLTTILETLADAARVVKDPDLLTGYARQALARQLTKEYQSEDGIVRAFTLDPSLEQMMADNLLQTDSGQHLVLDPDSAQRILEATRAQVERIAAMGYQPVALCSPRVRIHYRRLIERMTPMVAVLSYNELSSGAKLQTMGMVNVSDEDRADQIPQFA